eukprot:CAMPEP_0184696628 /NCGR_PEP_ID=MMETSP0313-20130426/3862_1 /TAXON_ID=2792 /ORGANISM="Porphyridium aerugineum, Strain SAG 1380-2" /LENGTH=79 /DNA_ID=CAMNT_0027155289 /DNA_START=42 /DNA_END=281 /DNA_ORIENTATION=-
MDTASIKTAGSEVASSLQSVNFAAEYGPILVALTVGFLLLLGFRAAGVSWEQGKSFAQVYNDAMLDHPEPTQTKGKKGT